MEQWSEIRRRVLVVRVSRLAALWPAAEGSLAKAYEPCIRKHCPACARGDKHPACLLSFSSQGRRKTMYVPQAMVSILTEAIHNGRKAEQLLCPTSPELLKNHRKQKKL